MAKCWQQRGLQGGLCEKSPGATLCHAQPVPESSKMEPIQDSEEPINHAGMPL